MSPAAILRLGEQTDGEHPTNPATHPNIQNTRKITKAMEMIAWSRSGAVDSRGIAGRPYATQIPAVLSNLAAQRGEALEFPAGAT